MNLSPFAINTLQYQTFSEYEMSKQLELHTLQATMTNIGEEIVIWLLLLTTANVHPKQIIYIDKVNGTLDSKCWVDKAESGTVEVSLDGVA